jgi:uncharacterized damage-inducible protein DinB
MNQHARSEEMARRLEAAGQELLRRVEPLAGEDLYRKPADGEWSVMQVLAHVAEMLPYWSRQAREIVARERDNEPFGRTHDDPGRVAAVEQHASNGLDTMLARLRSGLAEAVGTIRGLPPNAWARTAQHARRGEMTIEQIVQDFLVSHLDEHSQQIEATLSATGRH